MSSTVTMNTITTRTRTKISPATPGIPRKAGKPSRALYKVQQHSSRTTPTDSWSSYFENVTWNEEPIILDVSSETGIDISTGLEIDYERLPLHSQHNIPFPLLWSPKANNSSCDGSSEWSLSPANPICGVNSGAVWRDDVDTWQDSRAQSQSASVRPDIRRPNSAVQEEPLLPVAPIAIPRRSPKCLSRAVPSLKQNPKRHQILSDTLACLEGSIDLNLKNFIRHGKQARAAEPRDQPTTNVSPIHAQQQKHQHHGVTEPLGVGQMHQDNHMLQHQPGDYSVGGGDNRNIAAQAGGAAAQAAGKNQKLQTRDVDIQAIVAEEREKQGKLPRYPGLERYILVDKMGDGAFSNVYRARDTQTNQEVAIKVVRKFEMNQNQGDAHLHPDFKKQPKGVERSNILKEVQIMRQLDHPNIVKLIDFSESRQYYYIVLELCPGGELFHQIVRLTYFSEDLSRHVITQVAQAMVYLHEEKGVVHRDIKPENLLFYPTPFIPTRNPKPRGPDDEDKADEGEFITGVGSGGIGQIKIADFGLSKVVWDSQTMTPCGTVGYTAPEIVKDERYSKSVDMWALGCVLYTLLCGFPPFYDESIQVLTEKVARGQYTFLSPWWDDISKSAQDLVSHLLTVNPDRRYTIEQFLDHPWIRRTKEPTYAAADAPPLATPLAVRQKEWSLNDKSADLNNSNPYSLASPATPGGRRNDFRSPGAVNLREVFDVGYAVHRQEEEAKRRKNFKQGYRGAGAPGAALNPLNEDDDDYDDDEYEDDISSKVPKAQAPADVSSMEAKMRQTNLGTQPSAAAQARAAAAPARSQHHGQQQQERGYGQHSPAVAAAAKQSVGKRNKQPFELSLDNSTLLGRRNKGPGGMQMQMPDKPSKLREELSVR